MPTIGRATIDVVYDGEALPAQARAIGEKSGAAQADGMDEALQKGAKDTNAALGKEAEKAGAEHGEKNGSAYARERDKVIRAKTQLLAAEITKIFDQKEGIDKFVKNYDEAGSATDRLRNGLINLHEQQGITRDEFVSLGNRLDEYIIKNDDAGQVVGKFADAHTRAYEQMRRDLDEDDRARVRWGDNAALAYRNITEDITRMAAESTRRIDEATDRQAAAYEKKWGPAIDRAGDRILELREKVDRANGVEENGGLSRFLGKIDTFATNNNVPTANQRLRTLRDNMDRVNGVEYDSGLSRFRERLDVFADSVDRSGATLERRRGSFGNFSDTMKRFDVAAGNAVGAFGDAILGLGNKSEKAGGGAEKGAKGLSALNGPLRILSQFDPFDNPAQLFALIVALAPQVAVLANAAGGGILILAGALTALGAAGVGYGIGFSNLFGDLKNVDPAVRPAAKALQDLKGDFDDLRTNLQKQIFTPAVIQQFQAFGDQAVTAVDTAFQKIGPALSRVLLGVSKDLNSSGFKKDLAALFEGLEPSIDNLGGVLRNTFGIIGQLLTDATPYVTNFTGELKTATGKFLDFLKTPEGKNAVKDFLDNATRTLKDVGDAAVVAGGAFLKLVTPKNVERTGEILKAIGDAAPGLLAAADALGDFADAFADAAKIPEEAGQIGQFFEDLFTDVDSAAQGFTSFFKGINAAIDIFIQSLGNKLSGIGKAFQQAASGDFAGAAKTIKATFDQSVKDASNFSNALDSALNGSGVASFKLLDQQAQISLTAMAGRFQVPQSKAQEFGGDIARLADAAGVDIGRIASAKGWGEIQTITGATGTTIDRLKAKYGELPDAKTTKVTAEGAVESALAVKQFQDKIDGLKSKSIAVTEEGSKGAADRAATLKAKVDALANKSITVQETGAAGSAERATTMKNKIDAIAGKQVQVLESGAAASAERAQNMKNKIDAVAGKNVNVTETGAAPSAERAQTLKNKIDALNSKTVQVNEAGATASQGRVQNFDGAIDRLSGKTVQVTANVAGQGAVSGLKGSIDSLYSKTITVTTRFEQSGSIGRGSTQNRFGGIMAGGRQIAGGEKIAGGLVAYANGGILRRPTMFGNVLAGEAGPEAIVPLSGALGRVDSSVRQLSAFARGNFAAAGVEPAGTGRGVYIAEGAVQVISQGLDERLVGSSVMDRLARELGGA